MMKTKLSIAILVVAVICATGWYILHAKPAQMKSRPVDQSFLARLQEAHSQGEPWTLDPVAMVMKYHFRGASDPFEDDARIVYDKRNATSGSVTIHEPRCHDDSIHQTWTVYQIEKNADGTWQPISVESCWKGRGLIGWSTKNAN